ncbi:MAG: DsbA family protein [Clostridiales bacterium]|jgi:predicted DsbA family dithiol-disulfide isomerase|nr:DsbA family protein [Clostridiales bacterium]
MNKLEVFFDYTCPYCLRGHNYLCALLPQHPGIEVVWRPCEAHPRPEGGKHSDLCIQGMLFAQEQGADLWKYQELMYAAAQKRRIDYEDPDALAESVKTLLESDAFRRAIVSGRYAKAQLDLNDYAYDQNGVWALPAFRLNGHKLDSVEGVGVSQEQLAAFLSVAAGA